MPQPLIILTYVGVTALGGLSLVATATNESLYCHIRVLLCVLAFLVVFQTKIF